MAVKVFGVYSLMSNWYCNENRKSRTGFSKTCQEIGYEAQGTQKFEILVFWKRSRSELLQSIN